MNTERKNQTAQEAVMEELSSKLRHLDRKIESLSKGASTNYLHFFEWEAEELYKLHYRRRFYKHFAEEVAEMKGRVISEELQAIAHRRAEDFVRGCLTRNSTSMMANIAHTLGLEVCQELIREIESLAYIANRIEDGCYD